MNKEFKFWCKGTSSNPNFNKKGWWTFPNYLLSKYYNGLSIFQSEDFASCQSTGLTDSTGKKVFEGDIVCEKITPEMAANGDSANVGRVFFAAGTFIIDGDGPLYNHTYSLTPDRLEDYLVIGNIFETPELLK